jgi:hypothetical protein
MEMADTVCVVNGGLAITTNRIKGGGTEPKYLGWGRVTTAAPITDTGLQTPAAEARSNGTSTQQTTTIANDTYQVVASITSLTNQTISEIGLFDAAAAGNMYVHATFTGLPLNAEDAVQFTVKVKQTQV